MAAHAAAGRDDEANMLLHMYLRDARDAGVIVPVALVALVKTLTSMSIVVAGEGAGERFRQMANTIVMAES
jgi:protein subunit release factor B